MHSFDAGQCIIIDYFQEMNAVPRQGGVLDDISKQMGLWAQLRHIAGELRAIRGGGAARKASALRDMLRRANNVPAG